MKLINKALYVCMFAIPVALIGVFTLLYKLPIGPIILGLSLIPILGILLTKKSLIGAIPDMIFWAIDTGLLTIPVL